MLRYVLKTKLRIINPVANRKQEQFGGLLFLGLVLFALPSLLRAQIPSGDEIVKKMQDVLSPTNSKGVMTQTTQTSSGKTRTFEFELYSANQGEKTLMRYRKPSSVKGQTFLMLNNANDIWTYFPRTKRVRKLASHAKKQKIQGSDFTYEDLGSGEAWNEEYITTNLGEEKIKGEKCWKLKLDGIPEQEPPYPKMIIWVRQNDYYPLRMDYYNEKGRNIKTLLMEDIRTIDSYPTARKMVMVNHEEDTETRIGVISMTYDWNPPPGFFTERNLKK